LCRRLADDLFKHRFGAFTAALDTPLISILQGEGFIGADACLIPTQELRAEPLPEQPKSPPRPLLAAST
jgi:hypothetical protein